GDALAVMRSLAPEDRCRTGEAGHAGPPVAGPARDACAPAFARRAGGQNAACAARKRGRFWPKKRPCFQTYNRRNTIQIVSLSSIALLPIKKTWKHSLISVVSAHFRAGGGAAFRGLSGWVRRLPGAFSLVQVGKKVLAVRGTDGQSV